MAIRHENVVHGPERYSGLLCYPERAAQPLPAVLVIQEIWGLDAHIEDVTHRYAAAGYAAFAPDLYASGGARLPALTRERIVEARRFMSSLPPTGWRDPKAVAAGLETRPEPERTRIAETHRLLFPAPAGGPPGLDRFLPQVQAATRWLRSECPQSRGQRTGAVGFCMGGGVVALLACDDPDLDAAVMFYGSAPPLDRVEKIRCPVLAHYGELDSRVNPGIPAFTEAMQRHGKAFEPHVYPGAGHSFFNDDGPPYNVAAARESFARTLEFFRARLA